jgi:hypothetical protein
MQEPQSVAALVGVPGDMRKEQVLNSRHNRRIMIQRLLWRLKNIFLATTSHCHLEKVESKCLKGDDMEHDRVREKLYCAAGLGTRSKFRRILIKSSR